MQRRVFNKISFRSSLCFIKFPHTKLFPSWLEVDIYILFILPPTSSPPKCSDNEWIAEFQSLSINILVMKIFLLPLNGKAKFCCRLPRKKGELKKWPRKLKPQNEFDQNNDMQKYRIKNQFSVESFLILRLSISSFSLEPREISAIFSLLFPPKTMDGEKRVENYP